MKFEIPENTQFACIALTPLSSLNNLPELLDLGDGLQALVSPIFDIEETWRDWLGKIRIQELSESTLLLFTLTHTGQSDGWNDRELVQLLRSLHYALMMHGVYYDDRGTILCGGNTGGSITIRSVQDTANYLRPHDVLSRSLNEETFRDAAITAKGLRTVYAGSHHYNRLKRGFEAWDEGLRGNRDDKRIRQFVRAVEALIKPNIGSTRKQFVYRSQLFAGRTDQVRELLGELYGLRSCAEHMNDVRGLLSNYPEWELDKITGTRAFQAELLASYVYKRVFQEPELRKIFITDDSVESFWKEPEKEQMRRWGKPVDIESEVKNRFNPYL